MFVEFAVMESIAYDMTSIPQYRGNGKKKILQNTYRLLGSSFYVNLKFDQDLPKDQQFSQIPVPLSFISSYFAPANSTFGVFLVQCILSGEISNTSLSSHFYAFRHCDTLAFSLVHCRRIYTRSLNFFNRLLCKPFCSSEKEQKCIGTLLNVIANHVNQRIPGNSEGIAFTDEAGLSDSFCIVQEKA